MPPIFVSQRRDGVWDVIDGLQRLSTIFEFTGILRDDSGERKTPSILQSAKYLPALENKAFENWDNRLKEDEVLTPAQRLEIKRAKFDVTILMSESDPTAKYDLFQRLNTGGTHLSEQEVRNCVLIMLNKAFYERLAILGKDENFLECASLTERAMTEQYHLELVVRFLVFRRSSEDQLKRIGDTSEFLSDQIAAVATPNDSFLDSEEKAFRKTFELLAEALGSDAFRRFNAERDRFMGGFLVSAFEAVAMGIGFHAVKPGYKLSNETIIRKVKQLWANERFTKASGAGIRGSTRIPKTLAIGRELFTK